jgi:CubicO group peptidase (beta-lactamase class C family)
MVFLLPEEKGKIDVLSIEESVNKSISEPLSFEPGTKWQYSNCGINTGGRIIEIVSGQPYEEFMREHVFKPLGMVDTCNIPNAEQRTRLATSYRPNAKKTALEAIDINYLTYPLVAPTRFPCPGGGFFSTAEDLGKFARLLLNRGTYAGKRFLSEQAFALMISKQPEPTQAHYGIGFGVDGNGNGFGHGGAYATDLWIDSKRGLGFIYMVQHNGYGSSEGKDLTSIFHQLGYKAFHR